MTSAALEVEPSCPGGPAAAPDPASPSARPDRRVVAVRRPFGSIAPAVWDGLAGRNPWATPFSRWAFHRAWWDAYGDSAHDQTMVILDAAADPDAEPIGIVPLMHRHAVEPTDPATQTTMRHGSAVELTAVPPTAKAVFFGASYHADYATILTGPAELPEVGSALADALAGSATDDEDHPEPWDIVDLRRLRCADPAAEELAVAFGRHEIAAGWTLNLEREDVCPVTTIPEDVADLDDFLANLGKKERHEIRRKLRRAEAVGEVVLAASTEPLAELDVFIDLHQRKWGDRGLFPATPGGRASRVFIRRLFEGFGPDGPARLSFLTVGGRRLAAGITFEDRDTIAYYNAGVDPEARDLSPGVLMIAKFVERAIATGRRRLDFLRGNESYKYEWGAIDEPIQRLLVRRAVGP